MSKKLKDEITELSREISDRILSIEELKALDELRVHVLGKKGKLTYFLKELKNYDSESRVEIGSLLNNLKNDLINKIDEKKNYLLKNKLEKQLLLEKIDITLNSNDIQMGSLHPLSKTIDEISAIFADMGFEIMDGPDIETDYYNFSALNIPEDHPARQEHDTFYLSPDKNNDRKVL